MLTRLAALFILSAMPMQAAECRQALALGLDVSGSVSVAEYDLQLSGIARALRSQDVQNAFMAFPTAPVRLYIYEWSGLFSQIEVLPWTEIDSVARLNEIADYLETPEPRPRETETAIGIAMLFGGKVLAAQPDCWRKTLDISSDGRSNIGPAPWEVADDPSLSGVTINALVIGIDQALYAEQRTDSIQELSAYFLLNVIRGKDAFVEVALGYNDYTRAIEKKLLRELQTLPAVENLQAGKRSPL